MMQHRTFTLSGKLSVSLCLMLDHVKKKELPRYTALTAGYSGDLSTPTVSNDLVDINLGIAEEMTSDCLRATIIGRIAT
jgi:hypothetical protein